MDYEYEEYDDTEYEEYDEAEEMEETPDWKDSFLDAHPEFTEEMLECLDKSPTERTWQEVELADSLRHPEFQTQKSFLTDPETGEVLRDEDAEFIECARNTKGAQRPDGICIDDEGIHIREDKTYSDLTNLMHNICEQTQTRRTGFGDDVDLTYVVAPNFTVEQADKLQAYLEEDLGVNLEFQLK